jgi:acetyl esterase/lipase
LKEAGVSVTSVRYNGTIHDFVALNALRYLPSTEAALRQTEDGEAVADAGPSNQAVTTQKVFTSL